ncbi:hypothetical protein [Bradyrhizobium sp. 87]|nr:hypothetical protein [Bradyrhizobium sp. 87]MCK1425817.1 hypothetical protein [Bradyrhizobium sp. 87]
MIKVSFVKPIAQHLCVILRTIALIDIATPLFCWIWETKLLRSVML